MKLDAVRDYVERIDAMGELVRVTEPVSVDREIAEIADRCMKSPGGGPALLFESPTLADGTTADMPVGINLFGSMNRITAAFEVMDQDIGRPIEPGDFTLASISFFLTPQRIHASAISRTRPRDDSGTGCSPVIAFKAQNQ